MPRLFFPSRARASVSSPALLTLCLAWACAGVLGIEDAACDAEFAPECRSGVEALGAAGISTTFEGVGGSDTGGASGATSFGAGGSAGSGVGGNALAATEAPPPETACEEYCRVVAESCVGTDEQYASPAACLAVCAELDPGPRGDAQGNTVQCRLGRARLAATTGEPGDYCFSAGPGGAGICGDDCEGFCSVMTAKCTQMGSFEQCLSACDEVPDLSGPPTNVTYNTTQQSGDSVQCRLFHVTAASLDPIGHCVHAAGLAVCSPPSAPL